MNKEYLFGYRHCAVNIKTGTIISSPSVNALKRAVVWNTRFEREYLKTHGAGQWRFCHDFGKSWHENGLPQR